MVVERHSSEHSSGPFDNNESRSDMLTGVTNVRGIMSMDLNERSTAMRSRQKDVFKRFRRWAGKKLTAIRPVWPGRQRISSDVEVINDNNIDHQMDTLSVAKNVTAVTSTDLNEPPAAVISRRKGVFKRFRRWAGKRSRAVCRVCWPRRPRTENRVEVADDNENKPSNSDVVQNANNENARRIIEVTDVPSLTTTKEPETVINSTTDQRSGNVANVCDSRNVNNESVEVLTSNDGPIKNNLIGSDMNGNGGRVEVNIDPVFKRWTYRYKLFSRFDDGIVLDRGSFFFVCPEVICKHIAVSCRFNVAMNPFCGAGGMAIQLAMVCKSVIAMDIDAGKIKMARYNAALYGVQHKIRFVVGDFFATGGTMRADIVVPSPSWGRGFWKKDVFPLDKLCALHGGAESIMLIAKTVAPRVLMRLPTNASIDDCVRLGDDFAMTNLEKCFLDGIPNCLIVRFCSLTGWYNGRNIVRIDGSNAGTPRYCNTMVRLRSTGLRFLDRQKEEQWYFKAYMDSVRTFLATDDTNRAERRNN